MQHIINKGFSTLENRNILQHSATKPLPCNIQEDFATAIVVCCKTNLFYSAINQ